MERMIVAKMTRRAGFAALSILATTCVPASAADFARCDGTNDWSHSGEGGYRDLGGGYVSYFDHFVVVEPTVVGEPSFFAYGQTQYIEACASGKAIEVPAFYCADTGDQSCSNKASYDFSDEIDAILDQAAGSEPTTFDAIAASLQKVSPKMRLFDPSPDGRESCACHVAYPRLRGDKQKFSFPKD